MNTAVAPQNPIVAQDERSAMAVKIDAALFRGDVSKLTDEERATHMRNVCESIGLNYLTQPIGYVTLPNGKMVPYCYKGGTDQLRKLHGVNIEIVNRTAQGDLLTVHARAIDKTGRRDEDFGVVSIAGKRGEDAANAMLKAVTKAKRRVTLSICGLGWLDESEVEEIQGAVVQPFADLAAKPAAPLNARPIEATPPPANTPAPIDDIDPFELERTDDGEDEWKRWGNDLYAYIKAAKTFERIDQWIVANSDGFEALSHYDVGRFNRLRHMIQAVQDDKKAKAAKDDPR
jgi:hypothetical protein